MQKYRLIYLALQLLMVLTGLFHESYQGIFIKNKQKNFLIKTCRRSIFTILGNKVSKIYL